MDRPLTPKERASPVFGTGQAIVRKYGTAHYAELQAKRQNRRGGRPTAEAALAKANERLQQRSQRSGVTRKENLQARRDAALNDTTEESASSHKERH